VTPSELWLAVGRVLERTRLDRKWRPIDIERSGGPSYKTVQAIEGGDVGTVESLDKCARALDLSIVDILQSILAKTVTPLSPEAAQIVRKFSATSVEGRQAMLMIANALPTVNESTPPMPPIPAAGGAPLKPRPPRPGPRASRKRTGR
jgi:hypothetical protein